MSELTQPMQQSALQPPTFDDLRMHSRDFQVRKIEVADLWDALRRGYADFEAKSAVPFLIIFYFLAAALIALFASGQELRYLAFPIVAGFNLVGPIVAICFFQMSRRRERGLGSTWREAFKFVHTHSFAPLLALSLLMAALYVFWLYMAELIYFGMFGDNPPASLGAFLTELFTTRRGWGLIAYGNFVGFLFAFTTMAVSIVSFPLALDKPVNSFTAIRVSIKAFTSNVGVLAVWGLIVVALVGVGLLLFLVGLAVTLPVLGHATWHLYRKLIVPG